MSPQITLLARFLTDVNPSEIPRRPYHHHC